MKCVVGPHVLVRNVCLYQQKCRASSAWLNQARADTEASLSDSVDVEKLFIDQDVQTLLKELTGLDLDGKVFRERRTSIQQRSHFALMTDERLDQTIERMREKAHHFLQFVPMKEPRLDKVDILAKDTEIASFDTSKFVFTDITFDATDQDRTVVVREVDGTLRTANPEEHDRMNRTYYHKDNRPVFPPPVFEDPHLQNALDRDEHEFVLDWACWFYEPDDPSYVKLSQAIFDRVVSADKFDVLHSTRHFGPLVFYLALNGNIPPLLNHFGGQGRVRDCANLIRLQKTLHPDWRVAIGSGESDEKIVRDFIKQNGRFRDKLKHLTAFLDNGTLKSSIKHNVKGSSTTGDNTASNKATINANNLSSPRGPLGELSDEYRVKLAKGSEAESFSSEGAVVEEESVERQPANSGQQKGGKGGFRKGGGRFNNKNNVKKNTNKKDNE